MTAARRATGGLLTLTMVVVALAAAPAGARQRPAVSPTQVLATVLSAHDVSSAPGGHPSRARVLAPSRPITAGQTIVPVLARATSAGTQWLDVLLPGRPNGGDGWIRQRGTRLTTTSWHVVVRTSHRRVLVYRDGRLVRTFAAIVGAPATPTPHGRFFVEESVRMLPGSAGAPFALALSARSNVLQEFEGGPGQTAIHGTANLAGALGTASSHGCVRLAERSIRWLAGQIGPGVPVTITS
jgi:lipoprotein-anchoring transpeptidase ErfK/SrfK